jgi:hypothetical protein
VRLGRRQAAGWLRATVTTVGVLLLGVVLSLIAARLPLGTEGEHFAGHFSVGVTVLLLLLTVLWVQGPGKVAMEPAAEADQRAGGPVDIPDPVQQPPPAAQRPGVGQVGDRLLD